MEDEWMDQALGAIGRQWFLEVPPGMILGALQLGLGDERELV